MIDETKLSPAPWRTARGNLYDSDGSMLFTECNEVENDVADAALEFAALCRNWLAAVNERRWHIEPVGSYWKTLDYFGNRLFDDGETNYFKTYTEAMAGGVAEHARLKGEGR